MHVSVLCFREKVEQILCTRVPDITSRFMIKYFLVLVYSVGRTDALPYLTLPYLTLPYLTSPYLTSPYLTYLALPHGRSRMR